MDRNGTMTAFATVDNAVDAMKKRAYDYIVKPFQNDDLLLSIKGFGKREAVRGK